MTIEEAIKQLQLNKPSAYSELRNSIDMAIAALEKQIPKKPKEVKKKYWNEYVCPNCEKLLGNSIAVYQENCCHYCGQKIDWSVVEE